MKTRLNTENLPFLFDELINLEKSIFENGLICEFIFLDNNGREILKNLLVSLKRSGKTIICLTDDKLLDKISDNEITLGN